MKNLRYICVQPRILYYAWQVEVMINNFIKHGINPNNIDIVVAIVASICDYVASKRCGHKNSVIQYL